MTLTRTSSPNRQGGPSSQRKIGGASSLSVRLRRSRPVLASRSTTLACRSGSSTYRLTANGRPFAPEAVEPLAARVEGVVCACWSIASNSRSSGAGRPAPGVKACHQGFNGPRSPLARRSRRARSITT